MKTRVASLRWFIQRVGGFSLSLAAAYVLLILFLLALSVGFDPGRGEWRLGSVKPETIVLALLLFLPILLPRISTLSFPFFTGQASIQFRELHERIEVQEEKVAKLSNETDLLINSLAAHVLAPDSKKVERRDTIVIGCQRGPEQQVLGALLRKLLQSDLHLDETKVLVRYNYGGGALNFISLYRAKIDLCPAYTWQGYEMSLGPSLQYSADRLRNLSVGETIADLNSLYEDSEIRWLSYLGFSSNWELVMLEKSASALGIEGVEDLPAHGSRLILGCPREFFARDAGFGSLERADIEFREVRFMEGRLLYDALIAEQVDILVGFSTDSRLTSRMVRILNRTWPLFGDYYAVPAVREEILVKYPEIADSVQRLGSAIDGGRGVGRAQMRDLVRAAEGSPGRNAAIEMIAERFLKKNRLI